jgi:hypothetical protein
MIMWLAGPMTGLGKCVASSRADPLYVHGFYSEIRAGHRLP